MTYWEMSNGARYWWTLTSRDQLGDDRFTEQPFSYTEIVSVCVVSEVRFREEVISCDWPALHQGLLKVAGLRVEEMCDFTIPPAKPPNIDMASDVNTAHRGRGQNS
jgi:hypothetical protein